MMEPRQMWCREVRDRDQLLFGHVILWYVLGCVGRAEVIDALWRNIKQSQVVLSCSML